MTEEKNIPKRTNAPKMDEETHQMIEQLFQFVRTSDVAQLEEIFKLGFNAPNICDSKGNSLLMLASYNGQLEMTRVLLEHGGDPQLANDMGQIPLAGAAFKGNTAMAKLLIEHGADVNARMTDGKTPLMFAAMFNQLEIIDLLIEYGADASLQTADGSTAQSMAQAMGAETARKHLEKLTEN